MAVLITNSWMIQQEAFTLKTIQIQSEIDPSIQKIGVAIRGIDSFHQLE
jgi:hypothetical protein